jgi:hypothetical protein
MASTTPVRRPWTARLKDRWPTGLALGMTALTFGGSQSAEGLAGLSEALLLLPLGYLVAAGFFLHGVWDLVYFKLDRVVARSHDECAPSSTS